jgi:hydroxypyruvate isomerase
VSAAATVLNTSILLGGLSLPEQLRAAREHGFDDVELWSPFDRDDINDLVGVVRASGVRLVALNLWEGGMAAGNRGLASHPGRRSEFAASVDAAVRVGEALSVPLFNVLYGNRIAGVAAADQDAIAPDAYALAAERLAAIGGTILIESLSTIPDYPVKNLADMLDAYRRVASPVTAVGGSVGLLLDFFHLAAAGDDLERAFRDHADIVAHAQIADFPGRGGPGTGELPIDAIVDAARDAGYTGRFALEYSAYTAEPFEWMRSE